MKIVDVGRLYLTDEESMMLKELEEMLNIFATATRVMQSRSSPTINLIFATYLKIKNDLQKGFDNPDVVLQSIYKIALDNLDQRLLPTKFQLCAALMDPTMCNLVFLTDEIDNRFEMTRPELLMLFLKKYKFEELDGIENDDASEASSNSSDMHNTDPNSTPRSVNMQK